MTHGTQAVGDSGRGHRRILAPDGADETATLAALRDISATVIGPSCSGNRGKIVKTLGDGWLMAFASAVDAVNCAMQIQNRMAGHALFSLRIGVHAGDVIHEEADVLGDGVNIAARLERECEPGGIIVSDAVFISLDGTLTPSFDEAGERELKNIARPVRVWTRARPLPPQTVGADDGEIPQLVIAPVTASGDDEDVRDVSETLSSDLLSYLGTLQWMRVTLASPEGAADVYVLQSRLRTRGDKLRLEARLRGPDGAQVWTGKYDGALDDIFDWQDQTGEALAAEVMGMILDLEHSRLTTVPETELTANQVLLIGRMKFRNTSEEVFHDTLSTLARAIDMQPDFAEAYGEAIALTLAAATVGYDSLSVYIDMVPGWVAAARSLPDQTPLLELSVALFDRMQSHDVSSARDRIGRVLRKSPSNVRLLTYAGWSYLWMGETRLALDCFERYRRLSHFDPLLAACEGGSAIAHALQGNDTAAIRAAERGMQITTGYATLQMVLAASHARLGHMDTARKYAAEYLHLMPGMTIAKRRRSSTIGDAEGGEPLYQALELAGVPKE